MSPSESYWWSVMSACRLLELGRERDERIRRRNVRPHGNVVDAGPDQMIDPRKLGRAAGERGAEDDVGLAAVVGEKTGPRRLHDAVRGQVAPPRERAQLLRLGGGERQRLLRRRRPAVPGGLERERRCPVDARELGLPEGFRVARPAREPRDVAPVREDLRQRRSAPACRTGLEARRREPARTTRRRTGGA